VHRCSYHEIAAKAQRDSVAVELRGDGKLDMGDGSYLGRDSALLGSTIHYGALPSTHYQ
jgi:hypothetical protein